MTSTSPPAARRVHHQFPEVFPELTEARYERPLHVHPPGNLCTAGVGSRPIREAGLKGEEGGLGEGVEAGCRHGNTSFDVAVVL